MDRPPTIEPHHRFPSGLEDGWRGWRRHPYSQRYHWGRATPLWQPCRSVGSIIWPDPCCYGPSGRACGSSGHDGRRGRTRRGCEAAPAHGGASERLCALQLWRRQQRRQRRSRGKRRSYSDGQARRRGSALPIGHGQMLALSTIGSGGGYDRLPLQHLGSGGAAVTVNHSETGDISASYRFRTGIDLNYVSKTYPLLINLKA